MQPTLFLITSAHRGGRGLRPLLQRHPDIHLLGEVAHADQAVPEVSRLQPAALLVAADAPGRPLVPLMQDVHEASPNSKVIVLGDEATLERTTLLALAPLIVAYLMWADLRAETVPRCVCMVVEDDLVVGSRAVLDVYLSPPERRQRPRERAVVLSERQRAILKDLAAGMGRAEIACNLRYGRRTVDREIRAPRHKLGAHSDFALGLRAAQLGFVSS